MGGKCQQAQKRRKRRTEVHWGDWKTEGLRNLGLRRLIQKMNKSWREDRTCYCLLNYEKKIFVKD